MNLFTGIMIPFIGTTLDVALGYNAEWKSEKK